MARLDLGKVVPQKGVDYYTEQDKTQFANEVEADVVNNLKDINNLTYYTLAVDTGSSIELSINSSTYVVTLNLKNSAGTTISTGTIDLPLESVVVNGSYDSTNKKIILTLQGGSTVEFSVADLVSGLQSELSSSNKLNADYIDDSNSTNKLTNATEKSAWNSKYDKPASGIPSTDMSNAVQTSLGKADTAIQDISGKQDIIQYSSMPTASADTVGKIVQYTGTTGTYTKGYYYIGVTDGQETPTYTWSNIKVQDGEVPKVVYLENGEGTSQDNPFIFENHDLGIYLLNGVTEYNTYPISIYFKLKNDSTSTKSFATFGAFPFLYIHYYKNVNEATNGTYVAYVYNYGSSNDYYKAGALHIKKSSAASGIDSNDNRFSYYFVPTNSSGDVSKQVTYNTYLPTSTITPTTDNQLTRKGYVDNAIAKYSTMPTATSSDVDRIVQFIGTTDSTYTNGYFYKGVSDGQETPTYSWTNINVQEDKHETIIILNSNDDTNTRKEKGQKIIDYYLNKGYLPIMYYKEFIGSNFTVYDVHCNSSIKNSFSTNTAKFSVWYFESESNEYYGTPTFYYKGIVSIVFNGDYVVSGMSYTSISVNNYGRSFKPLASYGSIVGGNNVYGIDGYKNQCSALSVANTTAYTPTANYHPATKKYVDDNAKPIITTSDTSTYTIDSLTGNQTYKLGEITSLTITATTTFDKESIIYFSSGSTGTSISIPDTLTNLGDVPTLTTASNISTGTCETNKSYIISVLNDIAIWKAY